MLTLPTPEGTLAPYTLTGTPLVPKAPGLPLTRTAFAAAHVVSDPLRERNPWDTRPAVDWEATLAFRSGLWEQGLGLADAMDTAQRGMGVDWETARELIERTMQAAKAHPLAPRVACGAGTDHRASDELQTPEDIRAAYEDQAEAIEAAGGQLILMASRAFTAIGADAAAYHSVYRALIDGAAEPVILHWLGDKFDPALTGYWGHQDIDAANDFVLSLIAENPEKVDGIKISLLDQSHEEAFHTRLPAGVRLYTGDDFSYASHRGRRHPFQPRASGHLCCHRTHFSQALLGIFAAIAPAASHALEALAADDLETYHALLAPTVPLSREIFKAPTRFYKAGIAFLAWLNGAQSHFIMPGGFQSSREIAHYAEILRRADAARMLQDRDRQYVTWPRKPGFLNRR